ncbi:RagB/SusD family nutrient uptake outer membrane protein [Bacteroides clarus]|uniref:RagB/SusD family nutrient uptake outer membrane protein n=1 Tax=Bacteroides clarus TaxID=626929 RepID=UPI00266D7207|nr:RagB/SusD family nutrient uptake outer membrane protein [Bacteroides clarus]
MNRINYIIAVGCMLILVGCDSFLDRSPISNANENIFYKSEDDFLVATDAAYNSLYTLYGPESLPSFFGELMSDNAYSDNNIGNVKDYEAFDTHVGMDPSNSLVLGFWNSYYEAIYIINNILSKSNSVDFDLKLSLQAEVRFLRALYYFDMVRAWGDVPLVVKPLSVAEALQQPRTPQEQVYEAIIEDLQFAAKNLPDKKNERFVGAANEDAANTLLGKVYLTIGDKGKAEESLLKVYGKFSLVPYGDLWDTAKKNGVESIFEIQYMGGKSNPYSKYWAMFSPLENKVITAWGAGINQASNDLWNAYEAGDIRRDISIQNGYVSSNGEFIDVKYCVKWKDEDAELDNRREAADNNFIILRYADVLLMLTEATGNPQYLNEVRDRVNLPHYGEAGYPSQFNTVDLACEHERQVEFAMEFHRWFDLIRTGRAITVLKNSFKNITLDAEQLLLPIPLDVISQNPTVIVQNEAYK